MHPRARCVANAAGADREVIHGTSRRVVAILRRADERLDEPDRKALDEFHRAFLQYPKCREEAKMRKSMLAVTATLLGAAALVGRVAAQEPTKDVVNLDFSDAAAANQVKLNGDAKFASIGGKQRLVLTDAGSQSAAVFLTTPMQISNYLATFNFEVAHLEGETDAADGFTFLAQTDGPDRHGGGGTGLGFLRNDAGGPPRDDPDGGGFRGYNYAVEFNTYVENGPQDHPEAVALDLFSVRSKLNQTPFPMVDQGVFTAQVRVTPDVLTLTISGGKANMAPKVILTSPTWMVGFFNAPKPLYFGFTGGTGGLQQVTSILNLNIKVPPAE
jgi:Legume lectin domain